MVQNENRLTGKVIMVTGASAGIGEVTTLELARKRACIVLVGRNPEKCAVTVDRIRLETSNPQVDYLTADLSSQVEIRQMVREFKAKYDRLDVLVNNAGAVFPSRRLSVAWKFIILFSKGLTPEQGAQTSIYLAASPTVDQITGKYFAKQAETPSDPATYDMAAAKRFWDISARMVDL